MERADPSADSGAGRAFLLAVAAVLTGLNCAKPLTVDDAVYVHYASWIAAHPADPYGFKIWGALDANTVLAPPAFLYWWASGVAAFGDNPLAWKLWLFPPCLLLVVALNALARRFAPGSPRAVVALVALSPTFLPCVNLMLDVPAWALGLAAVALFLRACDRDSWRWALGAGLVAALACQTKYTGSTALAAILAYGVLHGRARLAALSAAVAVGLFVGWELLVAALYGDSHFWLGFTASRTPSGNKLNLLQPLFGHLGSAGAAGLLLGLAALGRSATVLRVAAGVIVIVFALVAAVPESAPAAVERALGLRVPNTAVLFGALGVVAAGLTVLVCRRAWGGTAAGRFLVAWLVVELLGYFALSPYPATRRIMGLVAVATILTCRVAAAAGRAHLLREVAVLNAALALLLFGADLNRYRGERVLAEQLAATANAGRSEQRTWMVANGAFEFYGARAGIEQLLQPGAQPKRGDRVLVVREFEPIFATLPMSARCVPVSVAEWSPELPLWSHYQFGTVAVARRDTPFTRVTVYRVR